MASSARRVAPLLFGSGFCALVYQVVWMREFRLVFGASTSAQAAVVAIFIAGLGLGGLLIGRRADRHPRPLWLYGQLELLIALAAAVSPLLLFLVRAAYIGAGGTTTLGLVVGTIARLLLAALVIGLPTVLMGGTLPAAARAAQSAGDRGRTGVALLYGVNTLGAVLGAFLGTFFMIEVFGNRKTLWLACLLNLLVALLARQVSRTLAVEPEGPEEGEAAPATAAQAPATFVVAGAAVVGFAFFLMELVWYRMLGPILGGTVFTFGLILTVALFGIGVGGALYSLRRQDATPTLTSFAHTCLLEALCIALPFAAGDHVALFAYGLRWLGSVGFFWGYVLGWAITCAAVVLPAAIVAGYQFPMLIALLGQGRREVGRQTGQAYAWNTGGAIAGSLAGGFGLLPLLTAVGAWRATGLLLVLLGIAAVVLSAKRQESRTRLVTPAVLALAAVALFAAPGPTSAWRHSGIGAGRAQAMKATPNGLVDWLHFYRRAIRWEADGFESSVALGTFDPGYAFVINGKIDGSARGDAATMIMSGLVGATLHPNPRRSLVIGLGTGGTAGWLGSVPTMESTDVVEIEARVTDVARDCAPINRDMLANPKVHLTINDARESLLVSRQDYDLIVSEPSNPYRAGVASLFTQEFYRAVTHRLREGGLFLQWVQAYEVDSRTIRTVYATLASVFPHVETWEVESNDMLLVASMKEIRYDAAALRERLATEPYRSAILASWRAQDLEGFLSRFVASSSLARAVAEGRGIPLNTDDVNVVEFGFARSVGSSGTFAINNVRDVAKSRGEHRPSVVGDVDWTRVEDAQIPLYPSPAEAPYIHTTLSGAQRSLAAAFLAVRRGDPAAALQAWVQVGREPQTLSERTMLAQALGLLGDERAIAHIDAIAAIRPAEADVHLARLRLRQGRLEEAAAPLLRALRVMHEDPWPDPFVMEGTLPLASELAARQPAKAPELYAAVKAPFILAQFEPDRLEAALRVLSRIPAGPGCADLLEPVEPHPPWNEPWLAVRAGCYKAVSHPLAARAQDDLAAFRQQEPAPFAAALPSR
jgi:spermidine synthase